MKLSIEDYNLIAEQEKEFSHALNESYFRIANRKMLQDYAAIYKRTFNKDSKILNGCNRCVLADIKQLATVYFKDKDEMAKNKGVLNNSDANVKNTAIETIEDENPVDTPKKNKTAHKGKKTTKK